MEQNDPSKRVRNRLAISCSIGAALSISAVFFLAEYREKHSIHAPVDYMAALVAAGFIFAAATAVQDQEKDRQRMLEVERTGPAPQMTLEPLLANRAIVVPRPIKALFFSRCFRARRSLTPMEFRCFRS